MCGLWCNWFRIGDDAGSPADAGPVLLLILAGLCKLSQMRRLSPARTLQHSIEFLCA
jgi:hypothetical protein